MVLSVILRVPSPAPGCTLPNVLAQSACVAPRGPSPYGLGGRDRFVAVSLHFCHFCHFCHLCVYAGWRAEGWNTKIPATPTPNHVQGSCLQRDERSFCKLPASQQLYKPCNASLNSRRQSVICGNYDCGMMFTVAPSPRPILMPCLPRLF